MTYKPKTTAEQRAALVDVVSERFPALRRVIKDLVADVEQAEAFIESVRRKAQGKVSGIRSAGQARRAAKTLKRANMTFAERAHEDIMEQEDQAVIDELDARILERAGQARIDLGLGPKGPVPTCTECGEKEATQGGLYCDDCRLDGSLT